MIALAEALGAETPGAELRALESVADAPAATWAAERRRALTDALCPHGEPALWDQILPELARAALRLGDVAALRAVESLTRDLERPIRAAIVGEFNAGKSSLINALLGEAVAPVGVLPTTATAHYLVWAPDRFARVVLRAGAPHPERVVAHPALFATLAEVGADTVEAVTIYAPLEPLRWVELLDTPGFNAPDAAHASEATRVLDQAHVLIWLTDATQPLKKSELDRIEALRASGLPLIVLVNKTDRLDRHAARTVLDHVRAALDEASVRLLAPVHGFSARGALEGSDPRAVEEWRAVERLLEEHVVRRSDLLRDHAERRRARALSAELAARARASAERAPDRSDELAELERRLARQRDGLEQRLAADLVRLVPSLERALAPVREAGAGSAAARFVRGKAHGVIAQPIAKRLTLDLGLEGEVSSQFRETVERVLTLLVTAAALAGNGMKSEEAASLLAAFTLDETAKMLREAFRPGARAPEAAIADTLEALAVSLRSGSTGSVLDPRL
jgi:GTP-binding protein EngB required for normal cell division